MDIDTLLALGFSVNAGMIDRGHKNYGVLYHDGVVLTDAGLALATELAREAQAAAPAKPRRRKADAEVAPDPEQVAE